MLKCDLALFSLTRGLRLKQRAESHTRGCSQRRGGRRDGCYYHLQQHIPKSLTLHNFQLSIVNCQFQKSCPARGRTLLILSHAVVVAGLVEHAAGDFTRLAVLDGDSLRGSGVRQRECLTVEGALSRRHCAVGGVVDCCAVRTADAYLSRLGKRGVTTNRGRSQRLALRTAIAAVVTAAAV